MMPVNNVYKPSAEELIAHLGLRPHPEGGWFRETFRSRECTTVNSLPPGYSGQRSYYTAIYYLLRQGEISTLHRIKSDELWHFYAGTALTVHILSPEGHCSELRLGQNVANGETFQGIVPAGNWFGAEVTGDGAYALAGCTVAPGFDFDDFEIADRETLLKEFPQHSELVTRLTAKAL